MGKKDKALILGARTAGVVSASAKVLTNPFRGRPEKWTTYYHETCSHLMFLGYTEVTPNEGDYLKFEWMSPELQKAYEQSQLRFINERSR